MCADLDGNRSPERPGRPQSATSASGRRLGADARLKNAVEEPAKTADNRVSMVDVAVLAGVSTQTVSRVANGSPEVRTATRRHVIAAMNELGYRPNSAARALRRGSFRTIGVITFSLSSPANTRTLEAIALHAARQDFAITLIPVTAPTQASIQGAFSRLGELAVDAVIAIMEVPLLNAATVTLPPGVKVVVVDSDAGKEYSAVDTDQADGTRRAVQHLLGLGHDTVWHVAGPKESVISERRAVVWRNTLTAAGRSVPPVIRGDWSADSGYAAGLRLADEAGCTAVFAANDHMALGLLRAFREKGKAVPEDISLVGFDDVPEASSYTPPLTTVRQNFADVGKLCVDNVLQQIRANTMEPGATLVPARLVIRQSTAAPPRLLPGSGRCHKALQHVHETQSQALDDDAIRIHVTSQRALDEELEVAVKQLQAVAMRTRTHGILVTRHRPGAYTATLSDQVPFGITMERTC